MDLFTLAGLGVTVGGTEAVHRQRLLDREAEAPERLEEFYLDVYCDAKSRKREEVHGARVVLRDGKVRLWPKDSEPKKGEGAEHAFTGFYMPFPMDELPHRPIPYTPVLGLVSTIPPSSPTSKTSKPKLNWLFADRTTRELRYGSRAEAKKHVVGHWDWTEDEQGLTLDGEECLVAVEEESGGFGWAVYWDRDDDALKGIELGREKRVLRVSLERRLKEEKAMGALNEE